jgi:hypothetical protein
MISDYSLSCIPLGGAAAQQSPGAFPVFIVCQLTFPQGLVSASEIRDAVAQHPLLKAGQDAVLTALVRPFGQWKQDRQLTAANTQAVTLRYRGQDSFPSMANALSGLLGGPDQRTSAGRAHDAAFDTLGRDHFLDLARTYDEFNRLTRQALAGAGVANLVGATMEDLSMPAARHLSSAAREVLIQALAAPQPASVAVSALAATGADPASLQNLASDLAKIRRRLKPNDMQAMLASATDPAARMHKDSGVVDVTKDDPNLAIHAAMKNDLLARACGFVTEWECQAAQPLIGDFVMALDIGPLPSDRAIVRLQTTPTALRRREHTHPLAFADVDKPVTGNGGLAALNGADGPRYRATSVNTETSLVKDLVLQQNNSLSPAGMAFDAANKNADQRDAPPQLLKDQRFGPSEPETCGVLFSAPVDDLAQATSAPTVQQRQAALPCLFLDDLWIGYRLDLAEGDADVFRSAHKHEQRISFPSGGHVSGKSEDFYEREQADETSRGYSSTEFAVYKGMSHAQERDYMFFLSGERDESDEPQPFDVAVTSYSDATRLLFGNIYSYRLRNVFVGGVSLDATDAALRQLGANYYQRFPFFRARAYRPGEIVPTVAAGRDNNDAGKTTIFLSGERPLATLTLVPTPIDVDTSRFHGLLLASARDPKRHKDRKFVRDAGKFFLEHHGKASYFLDPDVAGVIVRAKVLNGAAERSGANFAYEDGTYCEIVSHLELPPVKLAYGARGKWEDFRPITLGFRTSGTANPRIEQKGANHIEVHVPPAAEIEISIIPDVSREQLGKTASFIASSKALHEREQNGLTGFDGWLPIPAIAEQALRVIHAVDRPLLRPRLVDVSGAFATGGWGQGLRARDQSEAELAAYVAVDAASTGQVRLEASWYDIDDRPALPQFALNSGTNSTMAHSIAFRQWSGERENPLALVRKLAARQPLTKLVGTASYSFTEQFSLQCSENKVFLSDAVKPANTADTGERWHALDFKDGRRKIARVAASAQGRHAPMFGATAIALKSEHLAVDVPSTIRMTSPVVSHVLPISRRFRENGQASGSEHSEMAVRIFIRPPAFESGPGERVAIACRAGDEPNGVQRSLDKLVTQWGEDPHERPGLPSSTRPPRASDFTVPSVEGTRAVPDEKLYPVEKAHVLYRDNILVPADGPGLPARRLSVASFALQQDPSERLWYFDVAIAADFFGWCGLALYRHQPNALDDRELSLNAEWAYAAFLHHDPVTWVERGGDLHVTAGPVYDGSITFELDSLEFRNGVSENLAAGRNTAIGLQRYRVGRAYYFEGIVPARAANWSLTKKRFGYAIASIALRALK